MFEKFKTDPKSKDLVMKIIAVLIILSIILLSMDVFTQNKDGRQQIMDEDGGTEAVFCRILEDMKGVGQVDVMLQQNEDEKIYGVIITAEGAGNPVVRNDLVNAARAVFNIPASSVMVYEKEAADLQKERSQK